MKLIIGNRQVEQVLQELILSKTKDEAAATLTAVLITETADNYFPDLTLAVGDAVRLLDETGESVFTGAVHELRRSEDTVILTAYDRGIYLTRNELYGLFAGTGEQIARQVAAKLGIQVGAVVAQPLYRAIVSRSGESAFTILRRGAGEDREVWMEGETLRIGRENDPAVKLNPGSVLKVESLSSIRAMVNRSVVLRRNGAVAGTAENEADKTAYGQFQTVRALSGQDASAQAIAAMKRRELSAEVTLLGDLKLHCGCHVAADQPQWGLNGDYRVTGCVHRWKRGLFTTELSLEAME